MKSTKKDFQSRIQFFYNNVQIKEVKSSKTFERFNYNKNHNYLSYYNDQENPQLKSEMKPFNKNRFTNERKVKQYLDYLHEMENNLKSINETYASMSSFQKLNKMNLYQNNLIPAFSNQIDIVNKNKNESEKVSHFSMIEPENNPNHNTIKFYPNSNFTAVSKGNSQRNSPIKRNTFIIRKNKMISFVLMPFILKPLFDGKQLKSKTNIN